MSDAAGLHVLAVVEDKATVALIERVLNNESDHVTVARDLAEGLARAASEAPDMVLIEVAMGGGAGLAVVHHVRAIAPHVAVYALATAASYELGAQAVALGSTGVLTLPLAGDEVLGAVSAVRTRVGEQHLRERLEREVKTARLVGELLEALDTIDECTSRRGAAQKAFEAFLAVTRSPRGAVFLRASEASRDLMLTGQVGEIPNLPTFCSELELMRFASSQPRAELVRLASRTSQQGAVLLCDPADLRTLDQSSLERAGAHAAALVALGAEREAASRGSMKDPESSAYTFAYFVDVAGREIDKARRHGRRFAVATLTLDTSEASGAASTTAEAESGEASSRLIEHVLAAVRDTDILARVDEREFYLLLPETGGIGAHTCRRRVMRHFRQAAPQGHLSIGAATYPHDGTDLSQLMRIARHRADASRTSVVFRLKLGQRGLDEALDLLLASADAHKTSDVLRTVQLPRADAVRLAAAAVVEARRSGSAWAVATERPGLSLSSAVRAALGGTTERTRLECADAQLLPGGNLEAFSLITEHAAYSFLGRMEGDTVRAVHTADPLFSDFIVERLSELSGTRFWSS